MKTLYPLLFLLVVTLLFSACDDDPQTDNNANNTNNVNNVNNNVAPDFMQYPARVLSVSDGDTFYVRWHDASVKVRLKGVNTPEIAHNDVPAEPYGVEAMEYTKSKLPQSAWVGLEFDDPSCALVTPPASCFDLYDRLLAYARTDEDQDLGAQLLINGLGEVYTIADFNRKTLYLQYQQEAIDAGRGIWSK